MPVTMDRIPIYLRGGYITVRRDRARRSTAAMASDPLTLVVVLDADGHASGDVYLDDGRSYAFMRCGVLPASICRHAWSGSRCVAVVH